LEIADLSMRRDPFELRLMSQFGGDSLVDTPERREDDEIGAIT
jgi:hypothetical protein